MSDAVWFELPKVKFDLGVKVERDGPTFVVWLWRLDDDTHVCCGCGLSMQAAIEDLHRIVTEVAESLTPKNIWNLMREEVMEGGSDE